MFKTTFAAAIVASSALALKVETIPATGEMAMFKKYFSKYTSTFGVTIVADSNVPDAKVLHATAVLA